MVVAMWHPYAPDQSFGMRFAVDEERVNRFLAELEARNAELLGGPVTSAIALDAAVDAGLPDEAP